MRFAHLAESVLQNEGIAALQHSGRAESERCGVVAQARSASAGLHAEQLHRAIFQEWVEQSDGIRAAADAGHRHIGQVPGGLQHLRARLAPDHRLQFAHEIGIGMSTQARSASSMAARSVLSPPVPGTTVAPNNFMRSTLGACRSTSTAPMYTTQGMPSLAAAAALATPCCPAPVSAMMRLAPSRLASSVWPTALLILCAPVCARSSRFSHTCAPHRLLKAGAGDSAVGRPTQVLSSCLNSA